MGNLTGILRNIFGRRGKRIRVRNPAQFPKPQQTQPSYNDYKKGDVIGGRYEVHGILGKGGFGMVFLVSERGTRQLLAVKTFRDEFLADRNARRAFQKEALLWVHLEKDPFIVAARWVEKFSGRLFVGMDYVAPDTEGRLNLHDHLLCGKPLSAERTAEWAIQFCFGMEHANAHGVRCHGDIKPANILISRGTVRITDFGLAAAAEVAWKATIGPHKPVPADGLEFSMLRRNGKMYCGTPGYIPPEVYRGESTDVRSDIYSFGLVLWQMAIGSASPPFVGPFRGDIETYLREAYERQISGRARPVAGLLKTIVERCLNPVASQRYSNFGELRSDLEPIFQKLSEKTISIPTADERTAEFWSNKGGSLESMRRREDAIVCYDKALAIDPHYAPALINKGNALDVLGRHKEAIVCYDKALETASRCADYAWGNKGLCLARLGRHEEALVCYDKALLSDPLYVPAWRSKGASLATLGRHEDAIACLDKAISIDRRDSAAWNSKGSALVKLGRHVEAISCFDKAIASDPLYAAAWGNKGRSLGSLNRHEEAITCYDRAIATEPGDASLWNNKGASLAALGRRAEGLVCFDKALTIDPRYAMAWGNKAGTEDEVGRTTDALRSYTKFLEFAPAEYAEQINYARSRLSYLQNR
ncbi:MAG TPA: hypothetical protein DCK93_08950 [Blastocatellia bacterium]|nr:hypothetical protein [Blastocatellia bacterium]